MNDIATAGQSYTLGRSFTRANLPEVRNILSELSIALRYINGKLVSNAQPRFCR